MHCRQVTHEMWGRYGRRNGSGMICTGQAKSIKGDFEDRCHWWFEYQGVAHSEVFNLQTMKHEIVELLATQNDLCFDHVRKYTANQYDIFVQYWGVLQDHGYDCSFKHSAILLALVKIKQTEKPLRTVEKIKVFAKSTGLITSER
jgi:hypothetical protein